MLNLQARIEHELLHAETILGTDESNWGWHTEAGRLRKQRRIELLTRGLSAHPEMKVLEVGCGTGTFSEGIQESGVQLVCIDISDKLLEVARRRLPSITFLEQDAHALKFESGTFDAVLGCSVLHHLDWNLAAREIYRVVRPGGFMRFTEPNLLNPQIYLQKNWKWLKRKMGDSLDEYAFTPGQIRRTLEASGFDQIRVHAFEFLHPSTPKMLINPIRFAETILEKTAIGNIAGSIFIEARKASTETAR